MSSSKIKIINGDCIEEMKKLPANSVDSVICDPPYGLEFMGKEWDKLLTKERHVNYPSCRHAHGPNEYRAGLQAQKWHTNWAKEALRVAKPGATLMAFGGTRTYHRLACAIEDAGWEIFDCIFWAYGSGFPKSLDISKQLDKGHKRKVVGYDKNSAPDLRDVGTMSKENAGVDKLSFGQNYRPAKRKKVEITAPATPEAKLWNGWGTALKPAVEPIVVARKPKEGTYAENALKWGVAGLNIDGARIETSEQDKYDLEQREVSKGSGKETNINFTGRDKDMKHGVQPKGRFPSNLILDQEAAKVIDEQSNNASRFFKRIIYTPKASKRERNAGCEGLEEKEFYKSDNQHGNLGHFYIKKAGGKIGDVQLQHNNHPTVKPVKLMEYLCTLTKTPTGGVVLDPFMGSGTTGIACINTGRDFIGIEQDKEYCKIAEARLKYWQRKQEEKLI